MYKYADLSMTDNLKYPSKELLIHVKNYGIICLFIASHLYSKLLDSPIGSDFLTIPTLSWFKKKKLLTHFKIECKPKAILFTVKKVSV